VLFYTLYNLTNNLTFFHRSLLLRGRKPEVVVYSNYPRDPVSYFDQVKKDSKGYELWRVENGDRRLYLHVQDGIVTLITEYKR